MKIKEPDFNTKEAPTHSQWAHIFTWYKDNISKDDAKEYLIKFAEKNSPEHVDSAKKISPSNLVTTHAWSARLYERGCPFVFKEGIIQYLDNLKNQKFNDVEEKPVVKKSLRPEYDIEDFLGLMEERIDEYILTKKPFDINNEIKRQFVPNKFYKEVKLWADAKIEEFNQSTLSYIDDNGKVVEENVYHPKQAEKLIVFLTVEKVQKTKKIIKVRKVDPLKKVQKLKYLPDFPELNLKSINPVHIVGAKVCVVYNTKYKLLSVFKSNSAEGLTVKGSSIYNFIENIGKKKIKKPENDLRMFTSCSKEDILKTLDLIKTASSKLSGQMNEHTIILRVEQ